MKTDWGRTTVNGWQLRMFALGILQYELWKKGAGSSADCKEFRNGRNIKPIRGEKRASNEIPHQQNSAGLIEKETLSNQVLMIS